MKKSKKKMLGFSLMEVVITVTIIIVLSAISGPIYKSYATKAQLAEAYALLGTIRSAEDTYFNERNNYFFKNNATTCNDPVLGIDARPNKYYSQFRITGSSGTSYYRFSAVVCGSPKNITMIFDRTTGVTIQ